MSETSANKSRTGLFVKRIFIASAIAMIAGVLVLFAPNFHVNKDNPYLYIRDNTSFSELLDQMGKDELIISKLSFNITARLVGYDKKVRPGKYKLSAGQSNIMLIRRLRNGRQEPVQLKFNNIRTKEQLAGKLSAQVMADSISILEMLNDDALLASYGFNSFTSVAAFIPNTYEIYWDSDAVELLERMKKEYDIFWNEERKLKAAVIPLSPVEVMTIASIIEEETNKKFEYPIIAGLYINRLKKGMNLSACPTIKFALGDFKLKRILFGHIKTQSPYNTYINPGLPPGPIRLPSVVCIDAVLNYAKHDYLFMTAKETLNGEHNFAVTDVEHMANARKYQKAIDQMRLK
jgi:UPF0755 protein